MNLALGPEEPSIASKDLFPGQEQAVGIFRAFTQEESLRPLRLCVRSALRSLLFAMRHAPCVFALFALAWDTTGDLRYLKVVAKGTDSGRAKR
jgi:hypothetical protein